MPKGDRLQTNALSTSFSIAGLSDDVQTSFRLLTYGLSDGVLLGLYNRSLEKPSSNKRWTSAHVAMASFLKKSFSGSSWSDLQWTVASPSSKRTPSGARDSNTATVNSGTRNSVTVDQITASRIQGTSDQTNGASYTSGATGVVSPDVQVNSDGSTDVNFKAVFGVFLLLVAVKRRSSV